VKPYLIPPIQHLIASTAPLGDVVEQLLELSYWPTTPGDYAEPSLDNVHEQCMLRWRDQERRFRKIDARLCLRIFEQPQPEILEHMTYESALQKGYLVKNIAGEIIPARSVWSWFHWIPKDIIKVNLFLMPLNKGMEIDIPDEARSLVDVLREKDHAASYYRMDTHERY